jgi:PAS domain S-box-containing protein
LEDANRALHSDIAARIDAELEIVRINRTLAMLGRCHEALIRAEDEHTLLEQVCRVAVDVGGYRMAWVGYAQDDEQRTVKPMAHAGAEDGYLSDVKVSWHETDESGKGPGGQVIRSGAVVVVVDLPQAPGLPHLADPARRRGYRGVTVLPLTSPERTFGVLALYSGEVSESTPEEVKLLTDMANDLAFGIVNLRARARQQRMQTAVLKVAAGVSAASGTSFYQQLARNMAEALGANAAFVARLVQGDTLTAQTVAAVVDGELAANFDFPVAGTPCASLLAEPEQPMARKGVGGPAHFPPTTTLPTAGFLGKRLDSSSGHPLGLLFVVFREPPPDPDLITSALQIVAARAATELERQQTDERVREQAALLDVAHEAILVIDLADRIVYWNRGAERTYGWTAEEAIGRTTFGLLHSDPAPYVGGRTQLMREGLWESELLQHTKTGRDITVSVRWTLVRDAENHPRSILAINTDVTEARKLELQFFRAQRVESIGTLASGIAHDLNNVLAPILLSLEMLKDVAKSGEDLALIATLRGSAERGAALVRQVLSFARGVEGNRVTVDLVPLLADLVKVAQETFSKSIAVKFDARRAPWKVTGDATQMHQVFLNLLVNARDAMPEGGTLTVTIENVVLDETYVAMNPGAHVGAHVMVQVKDTGVGIPPAIRDRIFEPFFTTKSIGDGTGLGLSTTGAIVKSHGGFMHVYSVVGLGTDFRVYLPGDATAAAVERVAVEQTSLPRGEGELILVIDDEDSIRRVAHRTLERFGYRVLVAPNGAEGVAIYAARGRDIAAVLTDMAMPVMDGMATIIALKALDPDVVIIASSGLASSASVAEAVGAGIEHFVPKPYTAEALLNALDRALHRGPLNS